VAQALDADAGLDTIVSAGIAGPCPTCGTLASTAARFCSACGTPLDGRPDAAPRSDEPAAPQTPLADARGNELPDPEPATTELPSANGNGASPAEVEAGAGHET
jgi:hypothetical protein